MNDSGSPIDPRLPANKNSDANGSFQGGPPQRPGSKPRRPRRLGYYIKWTFVLLFCAGLATAGGAFGYFYTHSHAIKDFVDNMSGKDLLTGHPFASIDPDRQFPNQHTMNVLVLGCDADYVEHVDHPIPIKGAPGRSDSIMVAHIDFDKKIVNVLSIPRDTAAPIPGLRGYHKINGAHSLGGNKLSTQTISQDFGIPIDHTISLDFDSFQKVVDCVGGVDLTIHKNLNYDDNWANLHVHLKPGFQHLDGYKAMGYVRIRHSDNDLARAERQHEFIEALRARVMNPTTFWKLPDAINAVTDDIKSDLTTNQMLSLVHYATTLPKENIHLATMEGDEGRSYVYAYPDKAADIIGKMFFDGNTSAVKLNVASREAVLAMNHGRSRSVRSRRRKTKTHASETTGTRGITATPVSDINVSPDGGSAPTHTDRHSGNDGAGSEENNRSGSGHSDGDNSGDNGKSEKGSGGGNNGGNTNARRTGESVFS